MSEPSSRRSRRDGDRQFREEPDRRNRRGGTSTRERHGRDDRDRRRDDEERDHRRYRSRSRDRRDRRRSRSRDRDRDRDRGRDRERERDRDSDHEPREPRETRETREPREKKKDKGRRDRDRDEETPERGGKDGDDGGKRQHDGTAQDAESRSLRQVGGPDQRVDKVGDDKKRRRSASPPRSPTPKKDREDGGSQLPTRSRAEKPSSSAAPMSFKVTSHEPDRGRDGERNLDRGSRDRSGWGNRPDLDGEPMDEDEAEVEVDDDGLDDMQAMMGFGAFGSTKGKKIPGNNVGAVRKEKKSEYRQYMNRVGGFNRPLSPSR